MCVYLSIYRASAATTASKCALFLSLSLSLSSRAYSILSAGRHAWLIFAVSELRLRYRNDRATLLDRSLQRRGRRRYNTYMYRKVAQQNVYIYWIISPSRSAPFRVLLTHTYTYTRPTCNLPRIRRLCLCIHIRACDFFVLESVCDAVVARQV